VWPMPWVRTLSLWAEAAVLLVLHW
jgi:hypothetical protein